MSDSREPVTVFLPTWNGGARLEAVLTAIRGQRTERQMVLRAIDSSSTDDTRDCLRRHGAEVEIIPKSAFDHGETRSRGVRESSTPLVVLLTQDARPADEHWLEELLAPFADPRVAGTWARQVLRPGSHPFQRIQLSAQVDGAERAGVVEPLTPAEWALLRPADRARLLLFDDISSAVRRSVVEHLPFPRSMFGEDMAWARAVLLAGYRLVFASRSHVEHTHDVTFAELYERVAQTHALYRRLTDLDPLPTPADAFRRAWSTARAFAGAARRAKDLPLRRRLVAAMAALPAAVIQIAAIRRGARSATYEPPCPR